MVEWYENWFDEAYIELYPHRSLSEARQAVHSILPLMTSIPPGPMLDLACGQGRHLSPLVELHTDTFGMDLSLPLLKMTPNTIRSRVFCANMLNFPLKSSSLSAVFMWFTSFGYFDDLHNRTLIRNISDSLKPQGYLVIDLLNESLVRESLIPEDTQETEHYLFHNHRRLEGNWLTKDISITHKSTGDQRRVQERIRLYPPPEMNTLMRAHDLSLKLTLGAYDGTIFHPSAPRWIGIYQHS
ncbi:MAG: class I SAM-dependent methyltransferase [Holophagaceae bacterium]|jgi:SAM-dependent methyltransferase